MFSSLGQPSLWAITPRLVGERYYPAASALESSSYSLAAIIGPTVGGLLIAGGERCDARVPLHRRHLRRVARVTRDARPRATVAGSAQAGLRAIADGFRYLKGKPVLQGTYIVDFIAMVFGMPRVLFPFFADVFGGDQYLGPLYAAPALGALLASVLSGWTGHVRRHGLGVIGSVIVWGAAIFAFGFSPEIWWAVLFLALAGAADLVSVIFRQDDLGHAHLGRVPRAARRHRVGERADGSRDRRRRVRRRGPPHERQVLRGQRGAALRGRRGHRRAAAARVHAIPMGPAAGRGQPARPSTTAGAGARRVGGALA